MSTFNKKTFIKHDDYMTPKYAWKNIKQFIPDQYKTIYEPFYGDGKSGEFLKELLPTKNIIHNKVDFYEFSTIYNYDMILSNPPFSESKEVMNKLYELDKPFILIMPSSKINTQYFRIFKDKNLQIIIPRKRIHFEKKIEGKIPENWKNCCNFDCFYYCYKMNLEQSITWLN